MHTGEEMASMKKGANDGEDISSRSRSAKNLSMWGVGPAAEPGGLIGAKLWRWRWGTLV